MNMEFVKKEQNESKTKEYDYLKNISDVDRKVLKKLGFKFKDEQVVDGVDCEIWVRQL